MGENLLSALGFIVEEAMLMMRNMGQHAYRKMFREQRYVKFL